MINQNSREPHRYGREQSPLYQLSNKRRLAGLLDIDLRELSNLDQSGLLAQYRIFVDKKSLRVITEPLEKLALIHRRLLRLLVRIAPPNYVHSAIKTRSYKSNASAHLAGGVVLRIDIKKFFQSVRFSCIHGFFSNILQCAPDIATILAKLCVVHTEKYGVHLPTGSCISPILSFLANQPLFDQIAAISKERGCTFTLYVDDMTISGAKADGELLTMVAAEIFKRGYNYHKIKVSDGPHSLITGLIVGNGKLSLPHERAKKIRDLLRLVEISTGSREKLLASLVGRLSEAEQIERRYKSIRYQVLGRYKTEWQEIAKKRARKSRMSQVRGVRTQKT